LAIKNDPESEDSQADGILGYILAKGKASRKQAAWLKGYVVRLRGKVRPQGK